MNGSTAKANLRKRWTLFLRKLRSSYGILTDERNSYVLLQRTTEIRLRRNGYVMLKTTHKSFRCRVCLVTGRNTQPACEWLWRNFYAFYVAICFQIHWVVPTTWRRDVMLTPLTSSHPFMFAQYIGPTPETDGVAVLLKLTLSTL